MLYEARNRVLNIPYALLRIVSERYRDDPEADSYLLLRESLLEHRPDIPNLEEAIRELAHVMNRQAEEAQNKAQEPKQTPRKKESLLGKSVRDWLFSLDADGICILLAEWDFDRAAQLYWEVDHRDVLKMYQIKVEYEETRLALAFEGPLYAFGGELKGSGSGDPNAEVYDLTKMGDDGVSALAAAFTR